MIRTSAIPAVFLVLLMSAVPGVCAPFYSFRDIDVPGADFTRPTGINLAGQVVGTYTTGFGLPDSGYLLTGQTLTLLDVPGQ